MPSNASPLFSRLRHSPIPPLSQEDFSTFKSSPACRTWGATESGGHQGAAESVRRCPWKANELGDALSMATPWARAIRYRPCYRFQSYSSFGGMGIHMPSAAAECEQLCRGAPRRPMTDFFACEGRRRCCPGQDTVFRPSPHEGFKEKTGLSAGLHPRSDRTHAFEAPVTGRPGGGATATLPTPR